MQTVKAYRAYYDDGLFIPYEPVTIPKGCQVVVTVLDYQIEGEQKAGEPYPWMISPINPTIMREAVPGKSELGLWEGETTVPDDFNAPIDDLKEYMY